ncbi:sensor histidine kinase [Bordetella trematum]|uniref:sensor histidine kinase n=1 Tax=Bordetella trematum TaxID=123899 RepID=UPI003D148B6D
MSARQGTLTQRAVWALTSIVALFVTALALFSYLTFDQMEDELVDDILATETARVLQHLATEPDYVPARGARELGGAMHAWLQTPGEPNDDLPEPLRGLDTGPHLLEPGADTWHVMVADAGEGIGRVYVLYDATENEARVLDFGLFVLGVGAVCIIIAYGLARRLAGYVVRPLNEVTNRLVNWAPGAPDMTVTRDDEAGRLVEAFNRVQNRVDRSIAREREFAANLSHEVRTPLASIRSDIEMLQMSATATPEMQRRLQRIIDDVDSISASLESARAMARDEPLAPETVLLAECMQAAWQGLEASAERAGLVFINAIDPQASRELDRYALLTVLRNLLRNAIEHAAPATLYVSLDHQGRLVLADDGRGIAAAELPFVFQRYHSGRLRDSAAVSAHALPHGLGLSIAKQVCDMQGWHLTVESHCEGPERGTRFTLSLA